MSDTIRMVLDIDEYNDVKSWLGDHYYESGLLELEVEDE